MKLNKLTVLLSLLFISILFVSSTPSDEDYYIFPINPGQRNYLSGNFCELRSSHLHAGLDIKVGGVVGAPVHAAAAGYISRIKISWGSYGNALYLQHPNGTTTVYAHLDEYSEEIARYVREAQYKSKSFDIELFPDKEDLTVKRGEIIGKAGNSGSSGGPHLHFEIRDGNQVPLDPLQYNFSEIVDNTAPYVRKVALVTLDKDSRINGQFGRFEFPVRSDGNRYEVSENINVHGKIGVEIAAYDRADGVRNVYGVTSTEMMFDGEPQFSYLTDKLAFSYAKDIHVFTNYEERYRQDRTFYRLYVADGNDLPFYKTDKNKGKLLIKDDKQHQVDIKLIDHYKNSSSLRISMKGSKPEAERNFKVQYFGKPYNNKNYHIRGNVLQLYVPVEKDPEGVYQRKLAKFYADRRDFEAPPAYIVNNVAVYLWDLREGTPDSVDLCGKIEKLPIKMKVPAYNAFSFYQPEMDIFFPKSALFDTLYLTTGYQVTANREVFMIHEDNTPLRSSINVKLKPRMMPSGPKQKIHVYKLSNSGDLGYEGGEWNGNVISFNTRSFGDYILAADTIPPVVKPVNVSARQLKFKIEDKMSGIKSYDVYVNDKWVLMKYDYKWDVIWSDSQDDKAVLSGNYKLIVKDNVGNETVLEGKI